MGSIQKGRLKSVQLGVAAGLVLGFYLSTVSLLHHLFPPYGQKFVESLQELYPWYTPSWSGSFLIFGWGMLDGFFAFWLLGTLYNWLAYSGYGCRQWNKLVGFKAEKKSMSESEEEL